jgi:YbgC/YbaW family acyl-CoA thioester hydrolase
MFSISVDLTDEWITPPYDHVHHGRCFFLFEEARVQLLRHIGFPNDELLADGKALVITKVEAAYKREVKKGAVTVTCETPAIDGKTLVVHQKILNERGKIAVEARIESVFMDMNTRRGMAPPEEFKAAFLAWAKG